MILVILVISFIILISICGGTSSHRMESDEAWDNTPLETKLKVERAAAEMRVIFERIDRKPIYTNMAKKMTQLKNPSRPVVTKVDGIIPTP